MARSMFGRLWADCAEIFGGKQAMVGLRMIQISGMGSSGSKVAKNADFLHFWPRLPGIAVRLNKLALCRAHLTRDRI